MVHPELQYSTSVGAYCHHPRIEYPQPPYSDLALSILGLGERTPRLFKSLHCSLVEPSFKNLHCSLAAPTSFKNYPVEKRKLFLQRKLSFQRKILLQRKHPHLQRKMFLTLTRT